jgi:hypothetical protein
MEGVVMDKQEILERVLGFCDVRGDMFHWRREPFRRELFRIFQDSLNGPMVSADEIHEHVRRFMEPAARWNVPMQERVIEICTAWDDWGYAVENTSAAYADAR